MLASFRISAVVVFELLVGVILFGVMAPTGAAAQPPADEQLFLQMRKSTEQGLLKAASASLRQLCRQYPESRYVDDGAVLLHGAYLSLGKDAEAESLWQEMSTHRLRSETAWKMTEARFQHLVQRDPERALAMLAKVLEQDILDVSERNRVWRMRLEYLESARTEEFLKEALALIERTTATSTLDDIELSAYAASHVYAPLIAAGRREEARRISVQMRKALVKQGDPFQGVHADAQAYYRQVLEQLGSEQYLAEVDEILKGIPYAVTKEAVVTAAVALRFAYVPLAQAHRMDEACDLHVHIQALLTHKGSPDGMLQADSHQYLSMLNAFDPKRFVSDAAIELKILATSRSVADIWPLAELAQYIYSPLMQAGRRAEAREIHELAQAGLQRIYYPACKQDDTRRYIDAFLHTSPQEALTEIITQAQAVDLAADYLQLVERALLATCAYRPLMDAGKGGEARALFTQMHATLNRLRYIADLRADNLNAYYTALAATQPEVFLAEVQLMSEKLQQMQDTTETEDFMLRAYSAVSCLTLLAACRQPPCGCPSDSTRR